MQKYRQAALVIAFLSALFTCGLSASALAVARAGSVQNGSSSRIQESFESGDYESWRKLTASRKGFEPLSDKEKFNRFIAARLAARGGDYDSALRISRDLAAEIMKDWPDSGLVAAGIDRSLAS
jgi:hypothetical protein